MSARLQVGDRVFYGGAAWTRQGFALPTNHAIGTVVAIDSLGVRVDYGDGRKTVKHSRDHWTKVVG